MHLSGPAGAKSSKVHIKNIGTELWVLRRISIVLHDSCIRDAAIGVEEAIYVDAGATGKKYLSQFRS